MRTWIFFNDNLSYYSNYQYKVNYKTTTATKAILQWKLQFFNHTVPSLLAIKSLHAWDNKKKLRYLILSLLMNFPHAVTNIRPVHHYFRAFHAIVWVTHWVWPMIYIRLVENICLQTKLKPCAMLFTFFNEFDVIHKSTSQFSLVFSFCPIISFYPFCYLCFLFMCFKNIYFRIKNIVAF